jgi:hypothetical protein
LFNLFGAVFFNFIFWPKLLYPFWYKSSIELQQGFGLDLLFMYFNWLSEHFVLALIFLALPLMLAGFWNKVFFKKDFLKSLFRNSLWGWLALFLYVLSWSAPLWKCAFKAKIGPTLWAEVWGFYNQTKSGNYTKISSSDLSDKAELLPGSSYVFLHYFKFRVQRVLEECTREEIETFEKRKLCVALFYAASIQSAKEVKPLYLIEMASRVSLLLALDGIMRIIQEEGRNSSSLDLYLQSMESMGLELEKNQLIELISDYKLDDKNLIDSLIVLRRALDKKFLERQIEAKIPKLFQLESVNLLNFGL